jgi:glycosyltransferase involved in cell wall biosynthesis
VSSVIQQTFAPEEIILVDDFSDDNGLTVSALKVLQQLYKSTNFQIISLTSNLGPGGARNAGWMKARSKYLAFLDSDDSWHPQKLEIQITWMQAHPNVILTATRSVYRTEQVPLPKLFTSLPVVRNVSGIQLLFKNIIPTRTVVLRRDIGVRFDPLKRYAEDYLLWLRIVFSGTPAHIICLPLAYSFRSDFAAGGLTSNLWKMQVGVMHTYWKIAAEGHISKFSSAFFIVFSVLKFVRRLIVSMLIRIKSFLF